MLPNPQLQHPLYALFYHSKLKEKQQKHECKAPNSTTQHKETLEANVGETERKEACKNNRNKEEIIKLTHIRYENIVN